MLVLLLLCLLLPSILGTKDIERRTEEYCLKSRYHKETPSSEESLFGECARWKNNSCCNWNTTVEINSLNIYNFDFDHCVVQGKPNMSESCKRFFVLDLCFIECSPDLGFWAVPDDHKIRKERVKRVPLCASECVAWFEACKNDFTCTSNWAHSFDWSLGTNECLLGKRCRTILEVFQTAKNFCEQVWSHSWQYTDDSRPCMNLSFDEREPNPNIKVSKFYSRDTCSGGTKFVPYSLATVALVVFYLFFFMYTL